MSLAAVNVFKNMGVEALNRLEAGSTVLEPRDGATVFAQDDPADAVFAIVAGDGHVRVGSIDRHSKALMVEVFRAGEIFGEIGVIDGGTRTAAAVTEGKIRLVKIRGTNFLAALATSPELGDALSRMIAAAAACVRTVSGRHVQQSGSSPGEANSVSVVTRRPANTGWNTPGGPVAAIRSRRSAGCDNPQHHYDLECMACGGPGPLRYRPGTAHCVRYLAVAGDCRARS